VSQNESLLSGHVLGRNTLLNVAGHGTPLLFALVAIPVLIQGIGTERFGILALAWMAIGYFSLFDLGLGRALTQRVSDRLGKGKEEEVPAVVGTALFLMAGLGVTGAALFLLASGPLVSVLRVEPEMVGEARRAFLWLALALPFVIGTIGFRGVLESYQRFGVITALRIPLGALTFLGPLAVLPFSRDLGVIVAVLAVGRALAWGAHLAVCARFRPDLARHVRVRWSEVGSLFRIGGWITVSNLVSPLMVYLDRFVIGALIGMTAVTFYVTPYEVVTKLWIVPTAVLGVFFPAFAMTARQLPGRAAALYDRAVRLVLAAVFPAALVGFALAPELLGLWVGAEFAERSAPVARWLLVGVLVNSLAHVPFAFLQGTARPDIPAKLHLAEAPLYFGALWWALPHHGIVGAAAVWTFRVVIDAILLTAFAARGSPALRPVALRAGVWSAGAVALTVVTGLPEGPALRAGLAVVVLSGFAWWGWSRLLDVRGRTVLAAFLRRA